MATPVLDYDWKVRSARESKYNLVDWFDGQNWKLVRGEDYDCADKSMVSYLRKMADRRHFVITARIDEPGVIMLRARHTHI